MDKADTNTRPGLKDYELTKAVLVAARVPEVAPEQFEAAAQMVYRSRVERERNMRGNLSAMGRSLEGHKLQLRCLLAGHARTKARLAVKVGDVELLKRLLEGMGMQREAILAALRALHGDTRPPHRPGRPASVETA